jgi:ADP-heptose:LPS heptosyltransferase
MHMPIASLGRYLRPDWNAFPKNESGHLVADPVRTQNLYDRLHGDSRKVIGLSWKSRNAKFAGVKSARLGDFRPLLQQGGYRFIDLQYGDTQADREAAEQELGVRVEHVDDIDNTDDIDGLAALMCACDLIVTVSNTTAHLSGALGRPTQVFVPHGQARWWYWFKNRVDSPWYPNLRINRLQQGQSWSELINEQLGRGLIDFSTP